MTFQYNEQQAMRLKKVSFPTLFALFLITILAVQNFGVLYGLLTLFFAIIIVIIGHILYVKPVQTIMNRHNDYVTITPDSLCFVVDGKEHCFTSVDKIHMTPRKFQIMINGKFQNFYRVFENDKTLEKEIEHWVYEKN